MEMGEHLSDTPKDSRMWGYAWLRWGRGEAGWQLRSHQWSVCIQMSPSMTGTIYFTEVLSPSLKWEKGYR